MNQQHPALLAAALLSAVLLVPARPVSAQGPAGVPSPAQPSRSSALAPASSPAAPIDPVPHLRRLGCAPGHVLIAGARVFATCAGAGVWTLVHSPDGGLTPIERRIGATEARSLFVRDNDVWVQFVGGDAQPLNTLVVVPASAQTVIVADESLPPQASVEEPEGRVLSVSRTTAVVSLGKLDGLSSEDHVEVPVPSEDDTELGGHAERFAVGRVVATAEHRAYVSFGFAEPVLAGSVAKKSRRPLSLERLAPERVGNTLNFELAVRPYLPVRHAGIGALGELAVTYRASAPVYVRADVTPLGGRVGSGGSRGALGVFGSAGWDHNLFAVGVGAGLLERRDYGHVTNSGNGWTVDAYDVYRKTVPSFAVLQYVRVGALDGLHASFSNVLAIAKNSDEWAFGYLMMRGQIPLSSSMWLRPSAGGGRGAGFVVAELGLRALVVGNGRAGSVFVTPSVGVAGIGVPVRGAVSTSYDGSGNSGSIPPEPGRGVSQSYVVGPMVGVHAEYRMGL